jgi:uncharacterized protein (DUF1778 family)
VAKKKDELIKIRVTADQKRLLVKAAKSEGMDEVSTWLRALGLRRAKEVV